MTSLPAVSRAAALVAPGQIDIIELPVPRDLEPGAVLVKVDVATLCGTDIHVRDGAAGQAAAARLPIVLGHEMTGRIVRFGDGPRPDSTGQPLREGDRIIWTHGMCGRCRACVIDHQPSLCQNRRRYSSEPASEYPYLTGGLSEYCYVYPTSGRVKVPDAVPVDVAAASSCALRTMVQGFERLGQLSGGESVVIQGSGPLGLFALALAVTAGASNVIMIGGPSARLDLAIRWGARHVIDIADVPDAASRAELTRELTAGRGADVVIEVSGAVPAFTEGMTLIRPGGRYLVIGQAHDKAVPFNPTDLVLKQVTVIGSRSASVEHYWRGLEFLRDNAGRFAWQDMISSHYPLDEVRLAFDRMSSWQEIKPAIHLA